MPDPRVFAVSPDRAVVRWIAEELDGLELGLRVSPTVRELASAIIEQPPQTVVVDFQLLEPSDLDELLALRRAGWTGTLIGLGVVSGTLRRSLDVARVLSPPLGSEALRKEVLELERERPTTKLVKLERAKPTAA